MLPFSYLERWPMLPHFMVVFFLLIHENIIGDVEQVYFQYFIGYIFISALWNVG